MISDLAVPVWPKGVHLAGSTVEDACTGDTISVNETAAAVLKAVNGVSTVAEITGQVATEYCVDVQAVSAAAKRLLVTLNQRYLINLQPFVPPWTTYIYMSLAVVGIAPARPALRTRVASHQVSTLLRVVVLTWIWPLSFAWTIIVGLAALRVLPFPVMAWGVALLVAGFMSILLHEVGHLWASRRLAGLPAFFSVYPSGISVIRKSTHLQTERLIGLSGPLLAFCAGTALCLLGLWIQSSSIMVVSAPFLVHLFSLLPGSRDVESWWRPVGGASRNSKPLGGVIMKRLAAFTGAFVVSFATAYITFLIGSIVLTIAADLNKSGSFVLGAWGLEFYRFTRHDVGHTGTMQVGAIGVAIILAACVAVLRARASRPHATS